MEEESEQLLKNLLPSHWLVRKIEKDYGVDYEIEIVDGTCHWVTTLGGRFNS